MTKFEQIKSDMFQAMKAKEKNNVEVLKCVINNAQAIAKEAHIDITDDIVNQAITKEIKQLNQTIESIASMPDSALYKSSLVKKSIIETYLPQMMTPEEIRHEIYCVFEEMGITHPLMSDKGRVMKNLMPRVQGKADGKMVNEVLSEYLK